MVLPRALWFCGVCVPICLAGFSGGSGEGPDLVASGRPPPPSLQPRRLHDDPGSEYGPDHPWHVYGPGVWAQPSLQPRRLHDDPGSQYGPDHPWHVYGPGVWVTFTFTTTTTTTQPALCAAGIPSGPGIDSGGCAETYNGDNCTVLCSGAYAGDPKTYYCNEGTLEPRGAAIACSRINCSDGLPVAATYDVSACEGIGVGQSCLVSCVSGYIPAPALFVCEEDGKFAGEAAACQKLPCADSSKPDGVGVDSSDCTGKVVGESCTVVCSSGYVGAASEFTCASDGTFNGETPSCTLGACEIPTALSSGVGISTDCGANGILPVHDEACHAWCDEGFTGTPETFTCDYPDLNGAAPVCAADVCNRNLPSGFGVDASGCLSTTTGSSCTLACIVGFGPTSAGPYISTCQADGSFTSSSLSCSAMSCGDLSTDPAFAGVTDASMCRGLAYGQTCSVVCPAGFDPAEVPSQILTCRATGDDSAFQGFKDAEGHEPTPLSCVGRECSIGLVESPRFEHNCTGITTGQTCIASAAAAYEYSTADGGPQELTCGAGGFLEGSLPGVQARTCPPPTFPEGVSHACSGKTAGTTCWAYCSSNYAGTPKQYECNGTIITAVADEIACIAAGALRRLRVVV